MASIKNIGSTPIEIGMRYLLPGKVMVIDDDVDLGSIQKNGKVLVLPEKTVCNTSKKTVPEIPEIGIDPDFSNDDDDNDHDMNDDE